jgi:hypothetical protein
VGYRGDGESGGLGLGVGPTWIVLEWGMLKTSVREIYKEQNDADRGRIKKSDGESNP